MPINPVNPNTAVQEPGYAAVQEQTHHAYMVNDPLSKASISRTQQAQDANALAADKMVMRNPNATFGQKLSAGVDAVGQRISEMGHKATASMHESSVERDMKRDYHLSNQQAKTEVESATMAGTNLAPGVKDSSRHIRDAPDAIPYTQGTQPGVHGSTSTTTTYSRQF